MYKDNCLIRVLAACETMGNATNICSDKTGTLTENRMTVVEGWFGDKYVDQYYFSNPRNVPAVATKVVMENACINRTAFLVIKDHIGNVRDKPEIKGNATEGALIIMAKNFGFDYEEVEQQLFHKNQGDKVFGFNSKKKRSSAVVHRSDGSVRLYVKGAPEWVIGDCTKYTTQNGLEQPLNVSKRQELIEQLAKMADRALRTLCLAHRDFLTYSDLGEGWEEHPPDSSELVCDAVVGIIDPLRSDVKDAVAQAQKAGVTVRMCTGDNINTASAIARDCGILTAGGLALEGPAFRVMTPAQVDAILPNLQVLARSSPDDKLLLVTRLNGHGLPETKEEWEGKHPGHSWEDERLFLMPGYKSEWLASRPHGGAVVAVTGDGTNDAPALKAADVGLAMGQTGTQVAKDASDIVILDDKFSSIVQAIKWGRCVYDNIRRFLQFQLTVNVVALLLVFIGCAAGFDPPLNAVMMLWVNLIMDTLGALAIGTEPPTDDLLERRPYKRSAFLLSRPMIRNILTQSAAQLVLLLTLLFAGKTSCVRRLTFSPKTC
jgi:magnesium-transporting ATPase (P-type)